jgi:hypothetical protein
MRARHAVFQRINSVRSFRITRATVDIRPGCRVNDNIGPSINDLLRGSSIRDIKRRRTGWDDINL